MTESSNSSAVILAHGGFVDGSGWHLLPSSEQRTRQAVDRALAGGASTVDGLPTAQEPS
jgi:hypothetical protein